MLSWQFSWESDALRPEIRFAIDGFARAVESIRALSRPFEVDKRENTSREIKLHVETFDVRSGERGDLQISISAQIIDAQYK